MQTVVRHKNTDTVISIDGIHKQRIRTAVADWLEGYTSKDALKAALSNQRPDYSAEDMIDDLANAAYRLYDADPSTPVSMDFKLGELVASVVGRRRVSRKGWDTKAVIHIDRIQENPRQALRDAMEEWLNQYPLSSGLEAALQGVTQGQGGANIVDAMTDAAFRLYVAGGKAPKSMDYVLSDLVASIVQRHHGIEDQFSADYCRLIAIREQITDLERVLPEQADGGNYMPFGSALEVTQDRLDLLKKQEADLAGALDRLRGGNGDGAALQTFEGAGDWERCEADYEIRWKHLASFGDNALLRCFEYTLVGFGELGKDETYVKARSEVRMISDRIAKRLKNEVFNANHLDPSVARAISSVHGEENRDIGLALHINDFEKRLENLATKYIRVEYDAAVQEYVPPSAKSKEERLKVVLTKLLHGWQAEKTLSQQDLRNFNAEHKLGFNRSDIQANADWVGKLRSAYLKKRPEDTSKKLGEERHFELGGFRLMAAESFDEGCKWKPITSQVSYNNAITRLVKRAFDDATLHHRYRLGRKQQTTLF